MKHFFLSLTLLCGLWSISQASEAKVKVSLVSFSCILVLAAAAGIVFCLHHNKQCEAGYKRAKTVAVNVKNRAINQLEGVITPQNTEITAPPA